MAAGQVSRFEFWRGPMLAQIFFQYLFVAHDQQMMTVQHVNNVNSQDVVIQ